MYTFPAPDLISLRSRLSVSEKCYLKITVWALEVLIATGFVHASRSFQQSELEMFVIFAGIKYSRHS